MAESDEKWGEFIAREVKRNLDEKLEELRASLRNEFSARENALRVEYQKAIVRHHETMTDAKLTAFENVIGASIDAKANDAFEKKVASAIASLRLDLDKHKTEIRTELLGYVRSLTDIKTSLLEVLDDEIKDLRSELKITLDDAIGSLVERGGLFGRFARAWRAARVEMRGDS